MDINNLLEQFKQVQSIKEELKDMSWDDLASILEKAGVIDPEDYEGEPVGKYEILDCRYFYFDYTAWVMEKEVYEQFIRNYVAVYCAALPECVEDAIDTNYLRQELLDDSSYINDLEMCLDELHKDKYLEYDITGTTIINHNGQEFVVTEFE